MKNVVSLSTATSKNIESNIEQVFTLCVDLIKNNNILDNKVIIDYLGRFPEILSLRGLDRYYGKTLLMLAILHNNNLEIIKAILEKTPKLELNEIINFSEYINGYTALHIAMLSKNDAIATVSLLIEYGADVNKIDKKQQTPLFMASYYGMFNIVKTLIKCEASLNIKDNLNQTPLFLAVHTEDIKLVELLIKCGSSPYITKDSVNETAFDFAIKKGSMVLLLKALWNKKETQSLYKYICNDDINKIKECLSKIKYSKNELRIMILY